MAARTNGTTVADLVAASRLGAVDASSVVMTADEVAALIDEARQAASVERLAANGRDVATLSPTDHGCGIVGCRHGSAHTGTPQKDRQVKLQCPNCGAIARMTDRALMSSGGITCNGDGGSFAVAARRTYSRKGQ
jgi:predicted RNA-binding Zn-ribbon protein involved in translation (DUF1610 family)